MALVTDQIRKNIEQAFKDCEFLSPLPFCWKNGSPLVVQRSRIPNDSWFLTSLVSIIVFSFNLARVVEAYISNEWSLTTRMYLQMILLIQSLPLFLHLIALVSRYDIVRVTEQACNFFQVETQNTADAYSPKAVGALAMFLTYIRITSTVVACLYALHVVVNPNSPELISSVLRDSCWIKKLIAYPIVYAIYGVNLNCARVGAVLLCTTLTSVLLWSVCYLRMLRATLRNPTEGNEFSLRTYKRLALLVQDINEMVVVLLPAQKVAAIIPAVFSTLALMKLGGVLGAFSVFYAYGCLSSLQLLIKLIAGITQESGIFLKDFKRNTPSLRKSLLRKDLRALRPLRISVGKMYYVDKCLMITIMRIVVENTITVLILNS